MWRPKFYPGRRRCPSTTSFTHFCGAAVQWTLSEVNEFGRGAEPGRGVIHPTFYFASRIPGGLEILIGEGYQMTLWETES